MKKLFTFLFKTFPAMFSFLERWIDLQEKKLPMKIDKHEEQKEVREEHAKGDKIKEEIRTDRLEHKQENKAERRDDKEELGPMPNLKKKHQAKKKKNKEQRTSRKKNR